MQRLSTDFGRHAAACVAACIMHDAPELAERSAVVLHDLFGMWARAGIDEAEVWEEISKRLRLGDLMFELSQPSGRSIERRRRQWNVTSTKLP